ncbi:MAG TPA: helix-turn-helix domain-containing protein [Burkholderiaceae bacterium]|nr:helix-turn-helix domain-containing protein [Burkholderiaceae bacterium]
MNHLAYRLGQLASTKDRPGLLPVSPPTIWRWVKAGKFPAPYKLGAQTTVWDKSAVDAWLEQQRNASTPTV